MLTERQSALLANSVMINYGGKNIHVSPLFDASDHRSANSIIKKSKAIRICSLSSNRPASTDWYLLIKED